MRKDRESSADRIWKEKLAELGSPGDPVWLLSLVGAVLLVLIFAG
jgi:hypothetical protein